MKNTGLVCTGCHEPHATVATLEGPRSVGCAEAAGLPWTAIPHSIVIRGREYAVEAKTETDEIVGKGTRYELRGPRGAHYTTMRNVKTPHLMFLINARKFTASSVVDGVWLSDKDGALKVVQS